MRLNREEKLASYNGGTAVCLNFLLAVKNGEIKTLEEAENWIKNEKNSLQNEYIKLSQEALAERLEKKEGR